MDLRLMMPAFFDPTEVEKEPVDDLINKYLNGGLSAVDLLSSVRYPGPLPGAIIRSMGTPLNEMSAVELMQFLMWISSRLPKAYVPLLDYVQSSARRGYEDEPLRIAAIARETALGTFRFVVAKDDGGEGHFLFDCAQAVEEGFMTIEEAYALYEVLLHWPVMIRNLAAFFR